MCGSGTVTQQWQYSGSRWMMEVIIAMRKRLHELPLICETPYFHLLWTRQIQFIKLSDSVNQRVIGSYTRPMILKNSK